MGDDIAENLELMCDRDNPQDKKILLLARLMQGRFETLSNNQEELKKSLEHTNKKLDRILDTIEQYESAAENCPVSKSKDAIETLILFFRYPKLSFILIIGIAALLGGLVSNGFTDMIKALLGV
uniref:Uncharacterized protein n=1 Tax=Myoviridae sp. ctByu2 TaxID=2827668 RepID=A0A8S5SAF4_9CAUD|nr:MAG TPA: Protein of unknown function (DUF1515) [Myoviridae sp. ctByu2]